ncbi:hypothetical protein BJY52DRAFT_398943 [Lactarius psammicola]|nr:hypothetical protein BJY52DRAFT_398943 [Lactarius psammicola]
MAFFTLAFLAVLASSLVSAGPVPLDNATLLANGQQAQILNSEFKDLQVNDSCNTGETACIKNAFASCVDNAWQTEPCSSSKSCFALPQIRTNGTFVACTSQRNAASIIAATGAQGGITSNSTSGGNITVPFPIVGTDDGDGSPARDSGRNTTQGINDGGDPDCGDGGKSSSPGPTTITVTLIPPTTTTILPSQASSLISSINANGLTFLPFPTSSAGPGSGSGSSDNAPPMILLTSRPLSSPAPTSFPTPSPSVVTTTNGGYSY